MIIPLDNPTICAKGVVEHHLSFQKLIKEPWSKKYNQVYYNKTA